MWVGIKLGHTAHSLLDFSLLFIMSTRESAVNQGNSTALDIHDCSDWQREVHAPANAMVQDIDICIFVS